MSLFNQPPVLTALQEHKKKTATPEEALIDETKKILRQDLFDDKKILANLKQYQESFEFADEDQEDSSPLFSQSHIKAIAIRYRLKFLESKHFQPEFPYEAILKIKEYNRTYRKDLRHFYVLTTDSHFKNKSSEEALLFAKTVYGNYLLIHRWGEPLSKWRTLRNFLLRDFEYLFMSVVALTLCLTLCLPTEVITLDDTATYWSGYRVAAFFHLLIFNLGVTVFITFAFTKNLSSSIWNQRNDF